MQADGDRFASLEDVADNAEGVSQVRARFHLRQDGSLDTSSEYLRNGSWIPGHSATYTRAPDAQVVFR